jgi:chromosome segregation ATPase
MADPVDPNDLQEVRKIIESSTSKVSLRDLEKKGFRKVKVLRSNDIDDLIRRAVTAVVASEQGADGRVTEEIVERSRQELKQLMATTQAQMAERNELVEQNERLLSEVKELRSQLAQADEQRRRAEDGASRVRGLDSRMQDVTQRLADREREVSELRRRLEDAESRAIAYETRATEGVEASGKLMSVRNELSKSRDEVDDLRSKVKSLETEKRLVAELEVPKLRSRIEELEGEVRVQRAASLAAPKVSGVDPESMKSMFRDMLKEVGAGAGGGLDNATLKAEFAKMQNSIAQSLASAGGRGGEVTAADLDAAKVSIEALFRHDSGAAVVSNINDVKLKETTTTSDLKSKLNKLKSLRKGGST